MLNTPVYSLNGVQPVHYGDQTAEPKIQIRYLKLRVLKAKRTNRKQM